MYLGLNLRRSILDVIRAVYDCNGRYRGDYKLIKRDDIYTWEYISSTQMQLNSKYIKINRKVSVTEGSCIDIIFQNGDL